MLIRILIPFFAERSLLLIYHFSTSTHVTPNVCNTLIFDGAKEKNEPQPSRLMKGRPGVGERKKKTLS